MYRMDSCIDFQIEEAKQLPSLLSVFYRLWTM